jgi:DNA topoisomerase-1
MNGVVDAVAARLGNTRSVCRKCYIHPAVAETWEEGRLGPEITALRARYRRAPAGLDRAELLVLRWLETMEGETP